MAGSPTSKTLVAALLPAALLLLVPLTPHAGAQAGDSFYGVQVTPESSSVTVDYLEAGYLDLHIEDISYTGQVETSSLANQIRLDSEIVGNDTRGWVSAPTIPTRPIGPGEEVTIPIKVEAGATIENPQVTVKITVTHIAANGDRSTTNATALAVANPNPAVDARLDGVVPQFQPDQQKRVPLLVQNQDYYPQMISFSVQAPEGWVVSPPSSIQMAPGETQRVWIDIKAPNDPWFRLNPSTSTIVVTAQTETYEGGTYAVSLPTPISGSFLPGWVIPHLILLGLGLAVVGQRSVRKAREHRLEKGKPTFPGLPPEKEGRYRAMKVEDPEQAEQMHERLKKLWKERKEAWKKAYKESKKRARKRRRRIFDHREQVLEERQAAEEDAQRKREALEKRRKRRKELREKREELKEERERQREREEEALAEEFREKRQRQERGDALEPDDDEDD